MYVVSEKGASSSREGTAESASRRNAGSLVAVESVGEEDEMLRARMKALMVSCRCQRAAWG